MKVVVAGKGGVGKTTLCAGLGLYLAEQGRQPYLVDADPNACLGYALGWPPEALADLRPLSELREVLSERARGAEAAGGLFSLSPPVTDLIADYTLTRDGVRLLMMGTVTEGGKGCLCPENATLKAILRELVELENDLVVDMCAGLEHLGRGTAAALHGLVIVTDPSATALRSVGRIQRLAEDLKLEPMVVVANRITAPAEVEQIAQAVAPLPVVGTLSSHPGLQAEGVFSGPAGAALREEIARLAPAIEAAVG